MAIPTARKAGMKNALAPAKAMMVAAAVEMSVNRMIFLSCCMVRGARPSYLWPGLLLVAIRHYLRVSRQIKIITISVIVAMMSV